MQPNWVYPPTKLKTTMLQYIETSFVVAAGGPEPRKVSRFNLDNVFTALTTMCGNMSGTYGRRVASVITGVYLALLDIYDMDVVEFVRVCKTLGRFWVDFARRGFLTPDLFAYADLIQHRVLRDALAPLIKLRQEYSTLYPTPSITMFDKIVYGLFSLHRVVVFAPSYGLDTITGPLDEKANLSSVIAEIPKALELLGIDKEKFLGIYKAQCRSFDYTFMQSAGPNGKATITAFEDACAFSKDDTTSRAFIDFARWSGLQEIVEDIGAVLMTAECPDPCPWDLGKLLFFEEWGGKARQVAVLDYWTQQLLTPLHNTINTILKDMPADCTFRQEQAVSMIRSWTSTGAKEVYSFDLTAATDRLPIDFQVAILTHLLGSEVAAKDWAKVLTSRAFRTPDGQEVRYAVGQPMGARSSFAMLALSHHVMVAIATSRASVKAMGEYVIVGDDMTVVGSEVASKYQGVCSALGMKISLAKSHVHSSDCLSAGEMCKRTFIDGIEISATSETYG